MFAVGALVGGRFRVLRNFAPNANSIAVVEDAQDGQRRWLVAIEASTTEARVRDVLAAEERFALGVPGLARALAAGVDGGFAYLVYAGSRVGSVADARDEAWSVRHVAELAARLAAALAPLHDQGIAHGFVTPELVTEDAASDVLAGFGAAALATALGAPGEASQLISPEYRAPELRAALRAPTPASDVYALGVLLRELRRGPGELASSPENALFERATAEDPRDRPRDVRELSRELERCAQLLSLPPPAIEPPLEPAPERELKPLVVQTPAVSFAPPVVPAPPVRSSHWPVIALSLGGLLMLGGWIGVFAYVMHTSAKKPVAAVASAAVVKPTPAPAVPSPPPTPETEPEPVPEAPVENRSEAGTPRRHAAIVAPGVGPSSFPSEARVALPISEQQPIWGTRSAPLTWVLFGDLECPFTRGLWRSLEVEKLKFGDDLRIVFRHRPLREHPHALRAAQVLAGLQQRRGDAAFFKVLHRLSQGEGELDEEGLQSVLGLEGFGALVPAELATQGEHAVSEDLRLAGQFALRATPVSYLNGQAIDGARSTVEIEMLLGDEQRTATWLAASGVPAPELYATRTSSNLIGVGDAGETRTCVPLGSSPVRGAKDALLTLIEFSDFECQYCKRVEPTIKTLLARYPRALRVVWKNYPLAQHPNARLLANFAFEIGKRGAPGDFWTVHDGMFASEDTLDEQALLGIAGKAGLDGAAALSAARSAVHDRWVRGDIALGEKLGVGGTPTFFVNGRRLQGALPLEQFDALIQSELKIAQRIVARGVAPADVYGLVCD